MNERVDPVTGKMIRTHFDVAELGELSFSVEAA